MKTLLAAHEPLKVVIDSSEQLGTDHFIEFTISNESQQGIYLEQFQLQEPKQSTLVVLSQFAHQEERLSGPLKFEDIPFSSESRLLRPAQSAKAWFKIPLLDPATFRKAPFGRVGLIYSKLDEERPAIKEITFRLRRKN